MKRLLPILVLLLTSIGAMAENYLVVGASAVCNGEHWKNDAAVNLMKSSDNGATYTLTVSNVTLEPATEYSYKIVEKGSWSEYYPNKGGSNATFTVNEAAKYDITYTYTTSTKQCTVSTKKVGEAGAITHTYTVAGTANICGTAWKETLGANDMTDNGDGTYTWTKENVAISEADAQNAKGVEFKVVTDHKWDVSFPETNYGLSYLLPGAGNYSFEITFNATTKDIFASVYNTATITGVGYATFTADVNTGYTPNGKLKAFAVTVSGNNATLTPIDGVVAAGTGVILKGEADDHRLYAYNETDQTLTLDNDLRTSDGSVTGDGATIFVLNTGSNGVGFYPLATGKTLAKGKCYIKVEGNPSKQFIGFGNTTTGINALTTETDSQAAYNLAGQRVGKDYKGVVVKNGKKYINK